ncbi:pre protein translocase secY subunit [Haematococcus lacustris]
MAHSSGAVPSAPVAAAFASGSWQQAVAAGAAAAQVAALALQAVLQAAAQALVWTQQQPPLSWLLTALQPALRFCAQYHEVIRRIAVTLGLLAVIRCGLYIPLPGVDMAHLPASAAAATQGERLVKALYGQSQALPASLFELGISPLINASIAITMATSVPDELAVGWLQRLKEARKEGGRTGQATITSYMNSLSLAVAVYMGLLKALQLSPYAVLGGGSMFLPTTTLALVAGAAVVQYCSSLVTSDGLGNGTSLVICSNIVMDWADALHNMLGRMEAGDISSGTLLPLLATYLLMALAAVYISRTELRLPVVQYNRNSAAAIIKAAGTASLGAERSNPADDTDLFVRARAAAELKMAERSTRADYFPLAINASGMMSLILAGILWFQALPAAATVCGLHALNNAILNLQASWLGLALYGLLVVGLELLPLGSLSAKEVAEYCNAINVGIKGAVPGKDTEQLISKQLLRCKLWGGVALASLAVSAHVFDMVCITVLGTPLSATSLLIVVGTVTQASRQFEGLTEGPKLNDSLKREQALIQALRCI